MSLTNIELKRDETEKKSDGKITVNSRGEARRRKSVNRRKKINRNERYKYKEVCLQSEQFIDNRRNETNTNDFW